ncbi:trypsin-like serine protease [Streptomyces sp. NPDC004031]
MFPARTSTGRRGRRRALPAALAALGALAAGALASAPARADAAPPRPAAAAPATALPSKARADALLRRAIRARAAALPAAASPGAATARPNIIGGTPAGAGEAPWMVQIWYDDGSGGGTVVDDNAFLCGGTVVSTWKVLTAAHCVQGRDMPSWAVLVTGTEQLPTVDADGVLDLHGGTENFVTRTWSYPAPSGPVPRDDVAVLSLALPTQAPALPLAAAGDTTAYAAGTQATFYGWGGTSSAATGPAPALRRATLPMVADSVCAAADGSAFNASDMVCAGPPAGGSDAGTTAGCSGDSGGPLVVAGRLAGVMSWNVGNCVVKGSYGVFGRVSALTGAILPRMDDANPTGDAYADLLAVDSGGNGWVYPGLTGGLGARQAYGSYPSTTLLRQGDLDADGVQDVLARTSDGHLHITEPGRDPLVTGGGWNAMVSVVLPGDLDGDGWPDLVATDTSGNAWFYKGAAATTWGTRFLIGAGWKIFGSAIWAKGDLTGDGIPDAVARDSSGTLWLYRGTGKAPAVWAARTKLGTGWNAYDALAAVGDVNGDGHADLLARNTAGLLWIYHGTGSATAPYAAAVQIGHGWSGYSLLG